MHAEKTLSLYEYYLQPISTPLNQGITLDIASMRHKLPLCIQNEEIDFGLHTIVKVCYPEDPEALNHLDVDGEVI